MSTQLEPFDANNVSVLNYEDFELVQRKTFRANAIQFNLPEGFTVNGKHGNRGDWLLITESGHKFIVTDTEYKLAFEEVKDND